MTAKLRIGALGAARITPFALIDPARSLADATGGQVVAEVAAVAARDPKRAAKFAKKHRIPQVHESYDALLADPDVDAVYNPLPNSHHASWTIKALEAGKHVLCEKPFTSNANEARQVVEAAARTGQRVVEAFHWRFHPMARRMVELCRGGQYGAIEHIETAMCVPLPLPNDIRFRLELSGGAMMDTGAYAAHMVRQLSGEEPEVLSVEMKMRRPEVDRYTRAQLRLPSGATGQLEASLFALHRLVKVGAIVRFERGELRALNPVGPQIFHRLRHRGTGEGWRVERFGRRATYSYQLEAFVRHIVQDAPLVDGMMGGEDSIANMALIDAVYRGAGLRPRGA